MILRSDLVPLPGSTKRSAADAAVLNAAPVGAFEVTIVVRRRNPLPVHRDRMDERAGDLYKMSREERGLFYGADPEDVRKVEIYAQRCGLHILSSDLQHRMVRVSGDAESFALAFGVELKMCIQKGREYRCRSGDVYLPRDLQAVVTSVMGLDNRPFAKPHYRAVRVRHGKTESGAVPKSAVGGVTAAGTPGGPGLPSSQVAALYNFPTPYDGTGQRIAILELGGGYRQTELDTYFARLGIRSPVVKTIAYPNCGTNAPGVDPLAFGNSDLEVMLDIQVAGAVAPGATILVYFAPDKTDQSFFQVLSAIVHDNVNSPNILSISWGGPESAATDSFMKEMDQVLQFAKTLDMTVCVAAGDNGSSDYSQDDLSWQAGAHVDFPASDPYVMSCGGTALTIDANAISGEATWNSDSTGATGGGVSRFFALPTYQNNSGVPGAANPVGPVMRGVPDVAGNAAVESGYSILCDGQLFPDSANSVLAVGGTSAVAPLWAGLIARINQALGRSVGFVNPQLYALLPATGAFQDITQGNNGDYAAALGWDACTGLGSPNGKRLLQCLSGAA
jgi:kumamolisin